MSYYQGERRKKSNTPRMAFQLCSVVLAVLLIFTAVVQSLRLRTANATIETLNTEIMEKQARLDELDEVVPDTVLLQSLEGSGPEYQSLYPEMVVDPKPTIGEDLQNTAYLTFDDGPSANTYTILDALKASGQKATFFIVGANIKGHEDALQRMVAEGHTIAIHAYEHEYKKIYASVEAYLEDFNTCYNAIYEACGVYPTVFRFPGGSVNSYNSAIYQELIAEMLRRGFVYYDWNVSSEDATGKTLSAETITQNVVNGTLKSAHPIVLMHDAGDKKATAQAVPSILSSLTSQGYTCAPLTGDVRPIAFGYTS